jgi:hypothetical protein
VVDIPWKCPRNNNDLQEVFSKSKKTYQKLSSKIEEIKLVIVCIIIELSSEIISQIREN